MERLDGEELWDRVLSGGELLRIAYARLLLHKPGWVFMDEATAALDDASQTSMMSLFGKELIGSTLISIAHRAGLHPFHDRPLDLIKSNSGARFVAKNKRPHRPKPARLPQPPLRQPVP